MLTISNRDARRLWLWTNGLATTPQGPLDVMQIIRGLGFLQIDTIRNVTRAHNHILWTRNQNFREGMLWPLLRSRQLFEHFTHDASLIPMETFPIWQRQFRRLGQKATQADWYQSGLGQEEIANIRKRIELEGALSTHAFDTKVARREMWARPPHKKALDQMWYAGELATCYREAFVKFYNLGERVFPQNTDDRFDNTRQIDELCGNALNFLSFGTHGEINRFWGAMSAQRTKAWAENAALVPVSIGTADGGCYQAWAPRDIEARLEHAPAPTIRLRILNPFDPAIRDRMRLQRLFGFEYRNEMFVPPEQRRWGYYVYPLLEGDRFVGRCEIKGDRSAGVLRVTGFWPEPKVRWSAVRHGKLETELLRFARLAGLETVLWDTPRA